MVASSQSVTETIILQPKKAVNLDDVASDGSRSFIQLTKILKSQRGLLRQFWGFQVENPHLFVWSIDWESLESHTDFTNSEDYKSFKTGLDQISDAEAAAPVILYTRFTVNEATPAFQAGVTEIAFYTFPKGTTPEQQIQIEEGSLSTIEQVQSIGKATGASIGWTFKGIPDVPASAGDALCGVFGYASIEVHMKWRETPEGIEAGRNDSGRMRPSTSVPGIDAETGYFHVKFREG